MRRNYAWCSDCRDFRRSDPVLVEILTGPTDTVVHHKLRRHKPKWWHRKACPGSGSVSFL